MESSRYFNQSILRSLRILEAFSEPPHQFSIPEIARKVQLHRSTVHRLVITLESAGWLRKLPGVEKFSLGIKIFTLSRIAGQSVSSIDAVRSLLEDLAAKTGETAVLSMADNVGAVCVDKIESSQRLKISSEIGQHFPLHAGATGFAVLLAMPEDEVRKFLFKEKLPSFTSKTETDPDKILTRYRSLKEGGYVVSTGAVDPGVTGIAAPLFFAAENSYGSVGITMPEHRAEGETFRKAVEAVLETASAMTVKITFLSHCEGGKNEQG